MAGIRTPPELRRIRGGPTTRQRNATSIAKSCAGYSLKQFSDHIFSENPDSGEAESEHNSAGTQAKKNYSYEQRAHSVQLMMVDLGYSKPEISNASSA